MLYVIMNWIYMALIMAVLGTAVLHALQVWFLGEKDTDISLYYALMCGYVVCTVYAETVSLFMKVSTAANGILILITVCTGILCRKELSRMIACFLRQRKRDIVLGVGLTVAVFGFFLSVSGTPILLLASGDTGFYHSQAVRWIEEYGCVPGLANLNLRFGFNNANFCLAALFSMYGLLGVSIRGTVTFFISIVLIKALYDLLHIASHRYYVGDGVRILLLIYTLYRTIWMDGYSTECLAVVLVFAMVLAYCDLQEREKEEPFYYGLICLFIIYGATVKLNLAPLGIAIVLMIVWLVRRKKASDILKYIICGLAIVIPWIIRNVVLTGYLLYPFSKLDVFSFDWKVPVETVERLELITYQFAKAIWYLGVSYDEAVNYGFLQWFPKMLHYLFHSFDYEKSCGIMLIITIFTLGVSALVRIVLLMRGNRSDRRWFPLKLCLITGFVYCMLAGPDARFIAYAVFTLPAVMILQYIDRNMFVRLKNNNFMIYRCVLTVFAGGLLFICYLCKGAVASNLCYIQWHDYKQFLANPGYAYTDANPSQYTLRMPSNGCVLKEDGYAEADVDGLKIFYQTTTTSYHFVFYDPFPAVYQEGCLDQQYGERVHARGTDYKDGFWGEFVGY
ncbi:MAG: hypothetical protein NC541_06120 [bacterium]|nr:hypothetical protein [bacterium]MCM1499441.1 hypothetical protein [Clostridium sp.]